MTRTAYQVEICKSLTNRYFILAAKPNDKGIRRAGNASYASRAYAAKVARECGFEIVKG